MADLSERVVVITGASSGFGKGAALRFAEEGANLVLAARRKGLLKDLARECEREGVRALAVETDVGDRRDVEKLADRAFEEFGRIDVWVNNAGVSTIGRFDEVPLEEHECVIDTNLLGTMYGCYFAMREFRRQGEGVIINVASHLGESSAPYQASYVASKHAMRGLGMALRQELQANGEGDAIHVCTVMPTSMDTPFFEHAAHHGKPAHPIPPVYDPREVVETIVKLARNPQDEVTVGRVGKVSRIAGSVAPALRERFMAKRTHKAYEKTGGEAGESSGSLFKPMRSGTELTGGWRQASGGKKLLKVMSVGVPAGLAVAMAIRRRSRDLRPAA